MDARQDRPRRVRLVRRAYRGVGAMKPVSRTGSGPDGHQAGDHRDQQPQVVSVISAAIPNPLVSTPRVTMNHSNVPVPSASWLSAANEQASRDATPACPGVVHERDGPADRKTD